MKTEAEVRLFQRLMDASSLLAMSQGMEQEALSLTRIAMSIRWVLGEASDPPGLSEEVVEAMEKATIDRVDELLSALIEAAEQNRPVLPRKP